MRVAQLFSICGRYHRHIGPLFVLLLLGLPILNVFRDLYLSRDALYTDDSEDSRVHTFGWLYLRYNLRCWYWEWAVLGGTIFKTVHGDGGASAIGTALASNNTPTELSLYRKSIDDGGASASGTALLAISNNTLEDTGFA